jgi:hypothetical protein
VNGLESLFAENKQKESFLSTRQLSFVPRPVFPSCLSPELHENLKKNSKKKKMQKKDLLE